VHFGAALTAALERLGQEVVVDRREAYERDFREIDDVVLVLRGLEEVPAQHGAINLLWVISHPDLVTERELASFDRILVASTPWARHLAEQGHPAEPLLQATDPETFHPGLRDPAKHTHALFVGRSRNVLRPIVRDAVAAGLDLDVYGDGWEQFGLGDHVVAQYLPYDEVGSVYASADVVLNDHWTDMAREGFLSNRLFDAVAAGARVVSDEVADVEELFEGSVQVYHSVDELRLLCSPEGRERFPDDEERRRIGERVGREHSFEHRARQLLDTALALRAQSQR
jgi:spore maturation protein CgeB